MGFTHSVAEGVKQFQDRASGSVGEGRVGGEGNYERKDELQRPQVQASKGIEFGGMMEVDCWPIRRSRTLAR